MSERIKAVFDEIHADEQLKERTKAVLLDKKENHKIPIKKFVLAPICAVFICAVCFGFVSYNIEVGAISIDINPSIELGLNGYDRVINVNSFNNEGEKLINSVDIKNMTYQDAVNEILQSEEANQYMNNDNTIVVTVDIDSDEKADEVLSNVEKCNAKVKNVHCYKSDSRFVEEAHSHGVSFGKYNAYLELKKYEPNITVDEVKTMTMHEIKNRIDSYKSTSENISTETTSPEDDTQGNGRGQCNNHSHKGASGNKHKHGN